MPGEKAGNEGILSMRVWIDQDLCVGNGICEELCPDLFQVADGDIAYVRDGDRLLPKGQVGVVIVPPDLEAAVIDAAEECPAECIYLEAR
jgi:ferredoxin